MNEYTDHAVVDLDEAGSIIANKNIKIDYLNQKLAAAEAKVTELEAENEQLSLYKQLADEYGLVVFADLSELQKQRDGHVEEIRFLKREIDQLHAKKFARFANEDCWIYQGDGEDHLESLVCPVVISASRLLEIEKQRDELLTAAEAIVINAEECLDFDECTAMLVSIDDYHKLMEAVAIAKESKC